MSRACLMHFQAACGSSLGTVAPLLLDPLLRVALLVERQSGDAATLMGFLCVVLSHLLVAKGLARGVDAARLLARYILRALVEGGLTIVHNCVHAIEGNGFAPCFPALLTRALRSWRFVWPARRCCGRGCGTEIASLRPSIGHQQ